MLKRHFKFNKRTKTHNDFDEQFVDIEEFLLSKCDENGIDWRRATWDDKLRLAQKYGCKREFVDAMYMEKHTF